MTSKTMTNKRNDNGPRLNPCGTPEGAGYPAKPTDFILLNMI